MGVGRSSSLRTTADRSPLHDVRQHASPRSKIAAKRIQMHGRDTASLHDAGDPASSNRGSNCAAPLRFGGARRNRTDDLLLAKQALSQLSYGPIRYQEPVVRNQKLTHLITATWSPAPGTGGPGKI